MDGKLDKLTHMYRSPDIKTLGIYLDVPKGLVVKEVRGAAAGGRNETGRPHCEIEWNAGLDVRRPAISL